VAPAGQRGTDQVEVEPWCFTPSLNEGDESRGGMGTTWEGSFHLPRHYKCQRSHPWPVSSDYGHLDTMTRHDTTCHGRQLRRPQQCLHAFPDASAVHLISAHRAEKSMSQAERAKTPPHNWCGLCIQACRAAEFAVRATPYGARPVDLSDRPPEPSVQAPQAPKEGWVRALKESDYHPDFPVLVWPLRLGPEWFRTGWTTGLLE